MAFEIRIKPLVLFDLEDKIKLQEYETAGSGRQLYQNFLTGLMELQSNDAPGMPVYETVQKYVAKDSSCSLFYVVTGNVISIMGLL